MNRLANVLIAATDGAFADSLVNMLAESNYTALAYDDPDEVFVEAKSAQPDLLIIDIDSTGFDGMALAERMRAEEATDNVPVVLMASDLSPEVLARALDVDADDLFAKPVEAAELALRLRPLLRVSTMHAELHRRARIAARHGIDADSKAMTVDQGRYKVLVAATSPSEHALVDEVMSGKAEITHCDDLYKAEVLVTEASFDAMVIGVRGEAEPSLALCSQIRNNPRLFNLPVIALVEEGALADPLDAYRRGASRVLAPPRSGSLLHHALTVLVRRQRLRWAIRQAMDTTRGPAVCDSLTGLYTFDVLRENLEQMIENAKTWHKHLTVVFFSVPNVPGIRHQFGDEAADHLVQQLAQWISGLVRVEDLTARYQGHDFCVCLPDTPLEEARIVMHRIAGILSYTDFALVEVYQPITVWVEVGMAALEADDSAESLVSRARENLD